MNFESFINVLSLLHLGSKKIHAGIGSIVDFIQMLDKLPTKQKSSIITPMMLLKKSLPKQTIFSIMRFSGIIYKIGIYIPSEAKT